MVNYFCFSQIIALMLPSDCLQKNVRLLFSVICKLTGNSVVIDRADYFSITKTCLYNFDPLKPHFYIVKLGFTGVYIIFLISAQNIDCGYSLEPPR